MSGVDMTYQMILQEQAERQAQARDRRRAAGAPARFRGQRGIRTAVGSALIRLGTRVAAPASPALAGGAEH